uniref:Uncharacterized protein n=1 Tax=Aegilops tauschii subsp. strangulata TaxID=200361 RepID=A0A453PC50_AEGTS
MTLRAAVRFSYMHFTLSPASECGPLFIARPTHGTPAARVSARSARSAALRGWEKLGRQWGGVVEHGSSQDLPGLHSSGEEEGLWFHMSLRLMSGENVLGRRVAAASDCGGRRRKRVVVR